METEEKRTGLATPPSRKKARREGEDGEERAAIASSGRNLLSSLFGSASSSGTSSSEKVAEVGAGTGLKGPASSPAPAPTPATLSGRKRPRGSDADEELEEDAAPSTSVSTSKKGPVSLTLDLIAETVTVHNNTPRVLDLKGYVLRSEKGDQRYTFGANVKVKANGSVMVLSGPSAPSKDKLPECVSWTRRSVWNNHGDAACLVDPRGKVVSRVEASGAPQYSSSDVEVKVDLKADNVVISNRTSEDVSLNGWSLVSEVGDQKFSFPEGLTLAPGDSVTVWSGPDAHKREKWPTDLLWTRSYVWNNTGDAAILVDPHGRKVSRVQGLAAAEAALSGDGAAASVVLANGEALAGAGGPSGQCIVM